MVIGASTSNIWYKFGLTNYGWATCPSSCNRFESCPCTPTLDVDSMSDQEICTELSAEMYISKCHRNG
jgi:hypothetical protein